MVKKLSLITALGTAITQAEPATVSPPAAPDTEAGVATITDDYDQKFEQLQPANCDAHYLKRIKQFKKQNPNEKPGGMVLLGDSISEAFPVNSVPKEWNVISRGISGDGIGGGKYRGLINRLQISCHDLKPSIVFIKIGVNDIIDYQTGIPGTAAENRLLNYRKLIQNIKLNNPKAKVYISSILPVRTADNANSKKINPASFNPVIAEFNTKIRAVAEEEKINFVDLHKSFLEKGGTNIRPALTNDGIHLSKAGYDLWIQHLKKLKAQIK